MIDWRLKRLIIEAYGTQVRFSMRSGIDQARVSKLIRRSIVPSMWELQMLRKFLGREV